MTRKMTKTIKQPKKPAKPAPVEGKRPRGRPTLYTEELADEICTRLAEGEGLKTICRSNGMPDAHTVRDWAFDEAHPFAPRYARARDLQAEHYAELMRTVSAAPVPEKTDADGNPRADLMRVELERRKQEVDGLKWITSRLAPKRWGDRVTQEVSGPGGGPVEHKEITAVDKLDLARWIANILTIAGDKKGKDDDE